jgi:quinolinate synthase
MDNAKLKEKIQQLKRKRNVLILAHNYQIGEVQDIADYLGDSLGLSQAASKTKAEVIIFCGVHFMAETASILSPDKKVLMPDINAGCPMVDMITPEGLKVLKKEHPQALVVGYINTSAVIKAEIDVCCTSANAIKVVKSLKDVEEIIFVPDRYLANYISTKTNKKLIPWNGYCPTHVKILSEDVLRAKRAHPQAEVVVHPECTPKVIDKACKVFSTDGMCKYAKTCSASEIIVGTEVGLLYRLRKENPQKVFYPASEQAVCPNMKLTTLEKVLWALEDLKYEVKVPEDIRVRAKRAVDRMLGIL